MRLADLYGKSVRGVRGERFGAVHEVRVGDGQVEALDCGPASLIERLTGRKAGRRIPWKAVKRVTDKEILVDLTSAKEGGGSSA